HAACVPAPTVRRRLGGVSWPLLDDVPDEDVRRLMAVSRRRTFKRGEVVFHRDDPGDTLHLVVKGRFAIRSATPLGDTVTIAVRGPGDAFGEMALVSADQHGTATVAALEPGETLAVGQTAFDELLRTHPAVTRLLLDFLVTEVRRLNDRLLEA